MGEIDEVLKQWFLRVYAAYGTNEPDAGFTARNFRAGLRAAGYEIVPATSQLLEKGKESVEGGTVR